MLRSTGLTAIYFTLSQPKTRCLGHVLKMGEEQYPKCLLYSELFVDKRNRPTLRLQAWPLECQHWWMRGTCWWLQQMEMFSKQKKATFWKAKADKDMKNKMTFALLLSIYFIYHFVTFIVFCILCKNKNIEHDTHGRFQVIAAANLISLFL